jgi:hypothetical protein
VAAATATEHTTVAADIRCGARIIARRVTKALTSKSILSRCRPWKISVSPSPAFHLGAAPLPSRVDVCLLDFIPSTSSCIVIKT